MESIGRDECLCPDQSKAAGTSQEQLEDLVLALAERRDEIKALEKAAPRMPLTKPYRAALSQAALQIQHAIARLKEAEGFYGFEK